VSRIDWRCDVCSELVGDGWSSHLVGDRDGVVPWQVVCWRCLDDFIKPEHPWWLPVQYVQSQAGMLRMTVTVSGLGLGASTGWEALLERAARRDRRGRRVVPR
jgi:hypothetical protein